MRRVSKQVVCRDIFGKKFRVDIQKLAFRPAVYAIIVRNGKILLSKQWGGYALPGGGVRVAETTEEALKREVREETGYDIKINGVVACKDSFFMLPQNRGPVHSILIYYLGEVLGGKSAVVSLGEYEKEYAGNPEWVDLVEIGKIKFTSTVDNVEIIGRAMKVNG